MGVASAIAKTTLRGGNCRAIALEDSEAIGRHPKLMQFASPPHRCCATMRPNMSTFLVVDDDPTIRTMFARSLADLGEVEQAEGGRQAIQRLTANRYDAVLLDLHMPGVDGFAVLDLLGKEESLNRDTPVFVVTGDGSEQARLRALKLRSLLLLTKPVPLAMIRSLVDNALKKQAQRVTSPTPIPPRNPRRT